MGSLSSRPSVPSAAPQVVYVPQPTVTSTTNTTTTDTGSTSGESTQSAEQTASEARAASRLGRSRGRLGTIQTSFRGLLGLSDKSGERKSLLGE